MISLKEFNILNDELETEKKRMARVEGELKQLYRSLQKEHECKTLDQAEALQEKLQREIVELEKEFEQKRQEYEEDWDDILKGH